MLTIITLLTSILFAAVYPLIFWISANNPLKDGFHRFHIGLPNIIAGIVTAYICVGNYQVDIKIAFIIWLTFFTIITAIYWNRDTPRLSAITAIHIMGIILFGKIHFLLLNDSSMHLFSWIIGSVIFCSSLYAMNLGHWYLNVHGLPIEHLRRANFVFWGAVIIRLVYDLFLIFTGSVLLDGENFRILNFLFTLEGCYLLIGLFFGLVFPAIALYFSHETIKLKNTQSTTGILYVILCAVLIGDITFKYYAIRYLIAL